MKRSPANADRKRPTSPVAEETLDRLVLLLVSGLSTKATQTAATEKFQLDPPTAATAVREARRRIVRTARVHRTEEIGRAIARLHQCYRQAQAIQDQKTALAAQRELNRLLALYPQPADTAETTEPDTSDSTTLAAIAAHLLPLGLAPADYPIVEHARIAADRLRTCDPTCHAPPPTTAENAAPPTAAAKKPRPAKKSARSRRSNTPSENAAP